jgi:hypothetical protein
MYDELKKVLAISSAKSSSPIVIEQEEDDLYNSDLATDDDQ